MRAATLTDYVKEQLLTSRLAMLIQQRQGHCAEVRPAGVSAFYYAIKPINRSASSSPDARLSVPSPANPSFPSQKAAPARPGFSV